MHCTASPFDDEPGVSTCTIAFKVSFFGFAGEKRVDALALTRQFYLGSTCRFGPLDLLAIAVARHATFT